VVTVLEGEIGTLTEPAPSCVTAVAVELGVDAVPAPGGAALTSLGSFSTTYTTRTAGATLTREQRGRLRRAVGKPQAFSIDTIGSGWKPVLPATWTRSVFTATTSTRPACATQ
jgi:hypothetical protein